VQFFVAGENTFTLPLVGDADQRVAAAHRISQSQPSRSAMSIVFVAFPVHVDGGDAALFLCLCGLREPFGPKFPNIAVCYAAKLALAEMLLGYFAADPARGCGQPATLRPHVSLVEYCFSKYVAERKTSYASFEAIVHQLHRLR